MVTDTVFQQAREREQRVLHPLPQGLLVHVGCGLVTPEEWVNLDASWNLLAARVPGLRSALLAAGLISKSAADHAWSEQIRYCDVTRGLPFGDGEAAVIYASHVLEHLARHDAQKLVREAYRVLAPGGVLRLVVPDLERLARMYLEERAAGNGNAANAFLERLRTCPDYSNATPTVITPINRTRQTLPRVPTFQRTPSTQIPSSKRLARSTCAIIGTRDSK